MFTSTCVFMCLSVYVSVFMCVCICMSMCVLCMCICGFVCYSKRDLVGKTLDNITNTHLES